MKQTTVTNLKRIRAPRRHGRRGRREQLPTPDPQHAIHRPRFGRRFGRLYLTCAIVLHVSLLDGYPITAVSVGRVQLDPDAHRPRVSLWPYPIPGDDDLIIRSDRRPRQWLPESDIRVECHDTNSHASEGFDGSSISNRRLTSHAVPGCRHRVIATNVLRHDAQRGLGPATRRKPQQLWEIAKPSHAQRISLALDERVFDARSLQLPDARIRIAGTRDGY